MVVLPVHKVFSLKSICSDSTPPKNKAPNSPLPIGKAEVIQFVAGRSYHSRMGTVSVFCSTPATGPAKSKSTQILLIKFLLNNISYITITITILFYSHTIPLTVTSAITAGDFFTNRIRTKRARTPASGKSTAICDSFLLLACLSDTTVQCTLSPDTSRT